MVRVKIVANIHNAYTVISSTFLKTSRRILDLTEVGKFVEGENLM